MIAASRRFFGPGKSAPDHYGVTAASESFANIAAFAHPAVGNDRDVTAGLLVIVIARGSAIDCRGYLRDAKTKNATTGAGRAGSHTDQYTGHTTAHQLQRHVVGNSVADDDGNPHGPGERRKVQRFILRGNM